MGVEDSAEYRRDLLRTAYWRHHILVDKSFSLTLSHSQSFHCIRVSLIELILIHKSSLDRWSSSRTCSKLRFHFVFVYSQLFSKVLLFLTMIKLSAMQGGRWIMMRKTETRPRWNRMETLLFSSGSSFPSKTLLYLQTGRLFLSSPWSGHKNIKANVHDDTNIAIRPLWKYHSQTCQKICSLICNTRITVYSIKFLHVKPVMGTNQEN